MFLLLPKESKRKTVCCFKLKQFLQKKIGSFLLIVGISPNRHDANGVPNSPRGNFVKFIRDKCSFTQICIKAHISLDFCFRSTVNLGGHHSSVVSSAPFSLCPRDRIPSTPSTLSYGQIFYYICHCPEKRTYINKKRP